MRRSIAAIYSRYVYSNFCHWYSIEETSNLLIEGKARSAKATDYRITFKDHDGYQISYANKRDLNRALSYLKKAKCFGELYDRAKKLISAFEMVQEIGESK